MDDRHGVLSAPPPPALVSRFQRVPPPPPPPPTPPPLQASYAKGAGAGPRVLRERHDTDTSSDEPAEVVWSHFSPGSASIEERAAWYREQNLRELSLDAVMSAGASPADPTLGAGGAAKFAPPALTPLELPLTGHARPVSPGGAMDPPPNVEHEDLTATDARPRNSCGTLAGGGTPPPAGGDSQGTGRRGSLLLYPQSSLQQQQQLGAGGWWAKSKLQRELRMLKAAGPNEQQAAAAVALRRPEPSSEKVGGGPKARYDDPPEAFLCKLSLYGHLLDDNDAKLEAFTYLHNQNAEKRGPVRAFFYNISIASWFNHGVLVLIFLNCVFLAMEDPTKNRHESQINEVVYYSEYFFTVAFTIEMSIRVAGSGLVGRKGAYLHDPWNVLDFVIVLAGVTVLVLEVATGDRGGAVSGVRGLRILQPLRVAVKVEQVQIIFLSLFQSLPQLADVMLLYLMFLLLFGIMAVQLWRGQLDTKCFDDGTLELHGDNRVCTSDYSDMWAYKCPWNYSCLEYQNPDFGKRSFDHIGWAMLTLFTALTLEGWSTLCYDVVDATTPFSALFFVALVALGSFVIVQLTLAIIHSAFESNIEAQKEKRERQKPRTVRKTIKRIGSMNRKSSNLSSEWNQGYPNADLPGGGQPPSSMDRTISLRNLPTKGSTSSADENIARVSSFLSSRSSTAKPMSFRKRMRACVRGDAFRKFVSFVILLQTVIMATEFADQPQWLTHLQYYSNVVFTLWFVVEVLLKIVVLRRQWWLERFNVVDFVITGFAVVDTFVMKEDHRFNFAVLRAFRLLKSFKYFQVQWLARMWVFVKTIQLSILGAGVLTGVLLLIVIIYALLGMQYFGGKFCNLELDETIYHPSLFNDTTTLALAANATAAHTGCPGRPRQNFDTIGAAMLTVFQILTGEDWNFVMYHGMRSTHDAASVYFVTLVLIGNYLLLNLFVAVLFSGLTMAEDEDDVDADDGFQGGAGIQALQRADAQIRQSALSASAGGVVSVASGYRFPLSDLDGLTDGQSFCSCANSPVHGVAVRSPLTPTASPTSRCHTTPPNTTAGHVCPACQRKVRCLGDSLGSAVNASGKFAAFACGRPPLPQEKSFALNSDTPIPYAASDPGVSDAGGSPDALDGRPPRHLMPRGGDGGGGDRRDSEPAQLPPKRKISSVTFYEGNGISRPASPGPLPRRSSSGRGNLAKSSPGADTSGATESPGMPVFPPISTLPPGASDTMERSVSIRGIGKSQMIARSLRRASGATVTAPEQFSSFLFIPGGACVRVRLRGVVDSHAFECAVLLVVFVSSVSLALEDPLAPPDAALPRALDLVDLIIAVLFTLEALLKIFAYGFIFDKNSYLRRDAWNRLDFFIVVCGLVTVILKRVEVSKDAVAVTDTLRMMRTLRPLRAVSKSPGMQMVLQSLMAALPSLSHVFAVTLLIAMIFAIMGVQYFKGKFRACSDRTWGDHSWHTTREQCIAQPSPILPDRNLRWESHPSNFDNVGNAVATLYTIATLEGWVEVMHMGMDSTVQGRGLEQDESPWYAFYFVIYTIVGAFFLVNLFLGVLLDKYHTQSKRAKAKYEGEDSDRARQVEFASILDIVLRNMLPLPRQEEAQQRVLARKKPHGKGLGSKLHKRWYAFQEFVLTAQFDSFIMACIVLNTITMALEHEGQSEDWDAALFYANIIFISIFLLEALVKIATLSFKGYIKIHWNKFDLCVLVVSVVGVIVTLVYEKGPALSVFRVMRLARLVRAIRIARGLRTLIRTLVLSLRGLVNIAGIMSIVFFLYAIVGVRLFGRVERGEYITDQANFDNFLNAVLMLFRMCTGEAWQGVMHDCQRTTEPTCSNHIASCGHRELAYAYFVSFILVGSFIILNLVIAVILEDFMNAQAEPAHQLASEDVVTFTLGWKRYDPHMTGFIDTTCLEPFLRACPPPLGVKATDHLERYREVQRVAGPLTDYDGQVFIRDVLVACCTETINHEFGIEEDNALWGWTYRIPLPRSVSQRYEKRWAKLGMTLPEVCLNKMTMKVPVRDVMAAQRIQAVWRGLRSRRSTAQYVVSRLQSVVSKTPSSTALSVGKRTPPNAVLQVVTPSDAPLPAVYLTPKGAGPRGNGVAHGQDQNQNQNQNQSYNTSNHTGANGHPPGGMDSSASLSWSPPGSPVSPEEGPRILRQPQVVDGSHHSSPHSRPTSPLPRNRAQFRNTVVVADPVATDAGVDVEMAEALPAAHGGHGEYPEDRPPILLGRQYPQRGSHDSTATDDGDLARRDPSGGDRPYGAVDVPPPETYGRPQDDGCNGYAGGYGDASYRAPSLGTPTSDPTPVEHDLEPPYVLGGTGGSCGRGGSDAYDEPHNGDLGHKLGRVAVSEPQSPPGYDDPAYAPDAFLRTPEGMETTPEREARAWFPHESTSSSSLSSGEVPAREWGRRGPAAAAAAAPAVAEVFVTTPPRRCALADQTGSDVDAIVSDGSISRYRVLKAADLAQPWGLSIPGGTAPRRRRSSASRSSPRHHRDPQLLAPDDLDYNVHNGPVDVNGYYDVPDWTVRGGVSAPGGIGCTAVPEERPELYRRLQGAPATGRASPFRMDQAEV